MSPAALIFFSVTAFQTDTAGDFTAFFVWHGNEAAHHTDWASAVIVRADITGSQRLYKWIFFTEFGVADSKTGSFLSVKVKTEDRLFATGITMLHEIINASGTQMFKNDPFLVGILVEDPVPVRVSACLVDASLIMRPAVCLGDGEGF